MTFIDISAVLDWLVQDRTIAYVTWIGTLAGGVGLLATYHQARGARTAAQSAEAAVRTFSRRVTIANLAYSYGQLELVRSLVQAGSLGPAQAIFHSLKRMILEACSLFDEDKSLNLQVQSVKKSIKVVETHVDFGIQNDTKYEAGKVTRALAGLSDFLVSQEHYLKFASER